MSTSFKIFLVIKSMGYNQIFDEAIIPAKFYIAIPSNSWYKNSCGISNKAFLYSLTKGSQSLWFNKLGLTLELSPKFFEAGKKSESPAGARRGCPTIKFIDPPLEKNNPSYALFFLNFSVSYCIKPFKSLAEESNLPWAA